ncbi:competence/damage-inducible protein A [Rhodoblastus sp.]|uniref:competence/damage-inducible protein A n=1 Tax=Rhodoblastus sp. TaxID=1962975 RepID=UPI003F990139
MNDRRVTAAVLAIGDEILSGRTRDANSQYIVHYLFQIGIETREIRVVPDIEDEIVAALNALRARYDYVFSTGGIGPTHDDITADAVARAFGVGIAEDPRALAVMMERYRPEDLNEARRRMARIPAGAALVANPISKAPGFWIGNVIVMAGVPAVMQAMLDEVAPKLVHGVKILSEAIEAHGFPESAYAAGLRKLAEAFPQLSIGSYPSFREGKYYNQIVLRGRDPNILAEAAEQVRAMLQRLG